MDLVVSGCICGSEVQIDGHNGLSCRRSAGRQSRHHAANDIIARTFRWIGVPSILEPLGLIKGDGNKPDGATQIPWINERPLLWDFTCTLAPLAFYFGVLMANAENNIFA